MRRRSLRGRRLRLRCVSLECRSFGIGSWTPAVTPQRLKPRLTDDYVWRGWKPRPLKDKAQNSSSPEVCERTNPSPCDCLLSLHRQKKRLLECFRDPAQETGGVRAVDEAMVVGERERQNEPRLEFSIDPFRLGARTRQSKNRHFRMVDDGRKAYAPNPTQIGDGEGTAFHLCRRDLLLPRLL